MATTAAPTTYTLAGLTALAQQAGLSASEAATAAAVAMAESRGRVNAISVTGDYGLWQINARAHPNYDRTKLLEPAYNAAAMAAIAHSGRGWANWTTYRSGAYRQYLPSTSSSSSSTGAQGALGDFHIPGTDITIGIPGPGDVAGAAANVAGDALHAVVGDLGKLMLGLMLGTAGLALAGLGITRLFSTSETGQQLTNATQTIATVAAL